MGETPRFWAVSYALNIAWDAIGAALNYLFTHNHFAVIILFNLNWRMYFTFADNFPIFENDTVVRLSPKICYQPYLDTDDQTANL